MNDDQITAREYAEECCPIEAYEKAELIDPYKEEVFERKVDILATQIEFEQFLEWLLRRYCLVEKEAVRKEYDLAEKLWIKSACATTEEFNMGRMNAIQSLFPEIAKEVEG